MSIRFEIDRAALENNPGVVGWYRLFGAECIAQAQAIAAGRISGGTGVYERSFTVELRGGTPPTMLFGNSAPHAIFLEEGTDDHPVAPVNKKALRWFDPPGGGQGAAVFSKGHMVKGIKAMHIVEDAVSSAGDNLRRGSHRANIVD